MIQKDQKSQKRKNTYHIIRKIQTQSQKFEISHKKLEHKVVLYILPAKMRILCREIVPHRKRPHHRCMRCIIPINRITAVQHSVFDKKDIKHDPGQKHQQSTKKHCFFSKQPALRNHPCSQNSLKGTCLTVSFPIKDQNNQCCHRHDNCIRINQWMDCTGLACCPCSHISCPSHYKYACAKSSCQSKPDLIISGFF